MTLARSHFPEDKAHEQRRDFIPLESVDSLVLERDPSFEDYLFFHNVLDKFCWTAKLHYGDREAVKRKRHRLDTLFQGMLRAEAFSLDKAAKSLAKTATEDALRYHLTKGWLNELVRSHPLHPDYLVVGTSVGRWSSPGSGGFASWNIIQSYYAFFEYLATICVGIDPALKAHGHKVVSKFFNNHGLGKAVGRTVFYPFTLLDATTVFPNHPAHCGFHYATYPREIERSVADLEYEMTKAFALISKKNRGARASFVDFFYEFRLWANYTGVQSIITLSDGGYQKFLSQNLAIVFLMGGMAELAYIARFGAASYLGALKRFSIDYIDKHESFARNKFLIPTYVRLRILRHFGIVQANLDFLIPSPVDPVVFMT
jgi:hypothetical protein